MPLHLTARPGGVTLAIKVVPGSSRDRLAGEYAGGLRITVTQAAEKGAANHAVTALLSTALGLPRSHVEIIQGFSSPRKQVFIRGLDAETIRQRLAGGNSGGYTAK